MESQFAGDILPTPSAGVRNARSPVGQLTAEARVSLDAKKQSQ